MEFASPINLLKWSSIAHDTEITTCQELVHIFYEIFFDKVQKIDGHFAIVQEIFQLIVTIFQGLDDVNSPSFARRVNILETVAKVRSCVVMLDLECDDLILEMFHTFFDTARYYQFPALTILSITITMQLLLIFSLISSETSVLLELKRISGLFLEYLTVKDLMMWCAAAMNILKMSLMQCVMY